jgi:hypothetical protein
MPKTAALEALLKSYRDEICWLDKQARSYGGINIEIAVDCQHRARSLQAVLEAYDRLDASEPKNA